jgi:Zn ribbon nucleic-acid-binding protein
MSLYDYRESLEISKKDPQFYALIMCAMRKADTDNMAKLRHMWPEIYAEFEQRYHAPGGILPEDGIDVCRHCQGVGKINAWLHEGVEVIGCPDCKGTGRATPPAEENVDEERSGPCSACQTETTYVGEHGGDYPVWLCPEHGGKR